MLRISQVEPANSRVFLRLEGRVVGPWVRELGQICELVLSEGHKLKLDLSEVSFADDSGVALLTGLRTRGVELFNVTPFVEEQLKNPVVN